MRTLFTLRSLAGLLMVLATTSLCAQGLTFEFMGGSAYNFPTPLTVHQAGYPDVQIMANYDTEPFGPYTPYYAWRASLWKGTEAWEIEQVHHRLFLSNTNDVIQSFAIHYGYNYFFLGHAWKNNDFILHLGIGPILTNPSNTIRDQVLHTGGTGLFDAGYDLSGVGAQIAVSRNFDFFEKIFFLLDVGLMGGLATVPVVNGTADVPNLSLHGHLGFGVNL